MVLIAALALLLNAEPPRYLGGATPTPLAVPGPVDKTPSVQACTTETLRQSRGCVFDAHPLAAEGDDAKKKQAKNNLEAAANLGKGLCSARLAQEGPEPKDKAEKAEQARRMSLCLEGAARASGQCSLAGREALLDAEGRFSSNARACYEALASALQSADVPLAPKSKPGEPKQEVEASAVPTKI